MTEIPPTSIARERVASTSLGSLVQPNDYVGLRLPNGRVRMIQALPNISISLGKYGTFPSNLIIGRPYHLTYEVQDRLESENYSRLRIVSAQELQADVLAHDHEEGSGEDNDDDDDNDEEHQKQQDNGAVTEEIDVEAAVNDVDNHLDEVIAAAISAREDEKSDAKPNNTQIVAESNRDLNDDSAHQRLSMEDIEQLKRNGRFAGKDLIRKLLTSHTALEKKTAFSLEKYKLMKMQKYIRWFCVLPLQTRELLRWVLDEKKDSAKIMDMREEMLALLGCWANVHYGAVPASLRDLSQEEDIDVKRIEGPASEGNRYLVVDDTGGLLVAALAERMGILHPHATEPLLGDVSAPLEAPTLPKPNPSNSTDATKEERQPIEKAQDAPKKRKQPEHYLRDDHSIPFAGSNTITLVHANNQPNLAFLRYYGYDIAAPNPPYSSHPLYSHLLTLNWMQLLCPEKDRIYQCPPTFLSPEELSAMKANRRGTYHRKRRRWARTRYVVDSAREGQFSSLIVSSTMEPLSILRNTIPFLAPGAPVAIYSPTVEPLENVIDAFSIQRRGAWVASPPADIVGLSSSELTSWKGNEDFPMNPTLLVGLSLQTSRVRQWQVLPGRTHPMMTSRGGPEGYILTAWKALPADGKVEARGLHKRRKVVT